MKERYFAPIVNIQELELLIQAVPTRVYLLIKMHIPDQQWDIH